MPEPFDRSRRIRAVPDTHEEEANHQVEFNLKWKASKKVKIAAFLLGSASIPGGIAAGVTPWAIRAAGSATQADITKLREGTEANTKALQDAAAIKATSDGRLSERLAAIEKSISTIAVDVRVIGRRVRKTRE